MQLRLLPCSATETIAIDIRVVADIVVGTFAGIMIRRTVIAVLRVVVEVASRVVRIHVELDEVGWDKRLLARTFYT